MNSFIFEDNKRVWIKNLESIIWDKKDMRDIINSNFLQCLLPFLPHLYGKFDPDLCSDLC